MGWLWVLGVGFFGCGGLQFVVIMVVVGVIVANRGYDSGWPWLRCGCCG